MNLTAVGSALVGGLLDGGLLVGLSIGLTLIYGVLRVVNFAHGALLMLGVYLSLWLVPRVGLVGTSFVLLIVMGWAGLILYRLVIRPIQSHDHTFHLLATLGVALIIQNAILLAVGPNLKSLPSSDHIVHIFGTPVGTSRIVMFGLGLLAAAGTYLILKRTDFGLQIRAAAADPQAAELTGVSVRRVLALTTAIGLSVLGLISPWLLQDQSVTPGLGDRYVLLIFVVVILGGLGSVRGSVLGAFLVGLTQNLGSALLPGTLGLSLIWIIFVAMLLLRPAGLLPRTL